METFQLNFNPQFQDINPVFAGEAAPKAGHKQQNTVSPYTIIHYVRAGCGAVTTRGTTYPVTAGQIFIFRPGETAVYTADEKDPWRFRWVGFNGSLAGGFLDLPTVMDVPPEVFENLCDLLHPAYLLEYQLASEILFLQARVQTQIQKRSDPIQWVMDYIEASYMQDISVQFLADQVNLDRSYLYRLFKKRNGCSIQDYLLKIRLRKAVWYLEEGWSATETAALCGFRNMSNFYRQFKNRSETQRTPARWQKDAIGAELRRPKRDTEK